MLKTIQSPDYAVLLGLLRELRETAGLRQVDLAEQLGRTQSFVSKYEAGERRLDVLELRSICLACGSDLVAVVRQLDQALTG